MEVAVEPQLRAQRLRSARERQWVHRAPAPAPTLLVSAGHPGQRQVAFIRILGPAGVRQGRSAQAGRVGAAAAPERLAVVTRGRRRRCGRDQGGRLPPGRPRPSRSRGVAPPRRPGRAVPASPPGANRCLREQEARAAAASFPGAPLPDPACPHEDSDPARPPLRPASRPLRPRRRGARGSPPSPPAPAPARPSAPWTPRSCSPTPTAGTPKPRAWGSLKTSSTSPSSSIMTI